MWKIGDRVKTNRSIHGEMVGTIVEITTGYNQSIYHVRWETSKTGTITVKEVAGRDDRDWVLLEPGTEDDTNQAPKPSRALVEAIEKAPNLSSDHTKRAYKSDLAHFETWRSGRALNRPLVEDYLKILEASGKSISAINRALAAVRWLARRDMEAALSEPHLPPARLIARVDQALAISQVKNLLHSEPPPLRRATDYQVEALLAACAKDARPAGCRDAAMIFLASTAALKPGDLRRLMRGAIRQLEAGNLLLERTDRRGWVHTHRLTGPTAQALEHWLALWEPQNGTDPDRRPIFLAINKGGRIQDHGLSGQAVRDILRKRTTQAGLPDLKWEMLRNPVRTIQEPYPSMADIPPTSAGCQEDEFVITTENQ